MDFDSEIVHRAWASYQATDALSRLPKNGLDRTVLEDDTSITDVSRANEKNLKSPIIDASDSSKAEMNSTFGTNPPKLLEFNVAQQTDAYSNQARQYIDLPNTAFTYNEDEISV